MVGGWTHPPTHLKKYADRQIGSSHQVGEKIKKYLPPPTLPETNIAPESGWLEYYFPIGEAYFQGYVSFREGSFHVD